jgi:hypothetical protein
MDHSPSWEADSHSASQIPPPFKEPEGSLPCSKEPAIGPYSEPDAASPHFLTLFP